MKLTIEEFKVLCEALSAARAVVEGSISKEDGTYIKDFKKQTLDKIEKARDLIVTL